ncbi:hypothetical protein EB796_025215 [Bugula neritina]|uniref:Uncharacterized protein n=1 Tax=Bugula neritina TaxID=10212 RepID=A0A7J7ISV1_BUGNE|nr:hypothetical protein EB796_025224 [Bugula neritina]KAF6016471.1 hypothetical protein EB796_025215 [Bugula neritina]
MIHVAGKVSCVPPTPSVEDGGLEPHVRLAQTANHKVQTEHVIARWERLLVQAVRKTESIEIVKILHRFYINVNLRRSLFQFE